MENFGLFFSEVFYLSYNSKNTFLKFASMKIIRFFLNEKRSKKKFNQIKVIWKNVDLLNQGNSKGCGNQSIWRLGSIIKAFNLPTHQIPKQ